MKIWYLCGGSKVRQPNGPYFKPTRRATGANPCSYSIYLIWIRQAKFIDLRKRSFKVILIKALCVRTHRKKNEKTFPNIFRQAAAAMP